MTKALVVDDSRETANSLVKMLEMLEVQAEAIYGPREALLAVQKSAPDVIFLDVNMPGVSGLEVLRFLRREPATADMPIIIISSESQTAEIQRALLSGANIFLPKPIKIENLELAVKDALAA